MKALEVALKVDMQTSTMKVLEVTFQVNMRTSIVKLLKVMLKVKRHGFGKCVYFQVRCKASKTMAIIGKFSCQNENIFYNYEKKFMIWETLLLCVILLYPCVVYVPFLLQGT